MFDRMTPRQTADTACTLRCARISLTPQYWPMTAMPPLRDNAGSATEAGISFSSVSCLLRLNSPMSYDPSWPLTGFPQPNPFFPAPPRTGRKALPLPSIGKGLLVLGALCVAAGIMVRIADGKGVLVAVLVLAGLAMGVVSWVLIRAQTGSEVWNSGEIVPAIVTREAVLPDATDAALGAGGRMLGPGGGGLAQAAFGSARPATLEYVKNGQACHASIATTLTAGSVVWIILYQGAHLTLDVAPPPYDFLPLPEVGEWLKAALDHARGRTSARTTEQPPW